jgi:hypothetical protein
MLSALNRLLRGQSTKQVQKVGTTNAPRGKVVMQGESSITINGKKFSGTNVDVVGGKTFIDGVEVVYTQLPELQIHVTGNATEVSTMSGNVTITGDAGSVSTMSGDVSVGESIHGTCSTMSGDILSKYGRKRP